MQVELEPGPDVSLLHVGSEDVMTGEIEAVRVGLQSIPQRDARHADPVPCVVDEAGERVELLLLELGDELGDDRAQQHRAEGGAARREVRVAERDPPRRLVPTGVPDVELGEQHDGQRAAKTAAITAR